MSYLLLRKAVNMLLLTSLLSACTDHQLTSPAGQRTRLRQETIAYTNGSTFFKTDFEYDQLNRLSSLVMSFPFHIPGSSDTVQRDRGAFTYDEQNRVVRYDYRIDYHLYSQKPLVEGERIDVTYDASGKTATIIRSEALNNFSDFKSIEKRRLEFGANNQVIKETYISLSDGSESTNVYNYVNGNIVETGPDFLVEYDNAPNPYYELPLPLTVTGRSRSGYSRNNVIKTVSTSRFPQTDGTELITTSTAVYNNSYNDKGLLVKSVLMITPLTRGSSFFPNTRYFVYETY